MARFVLVHGAWHASWCWDGVADMLRAKGHRVEAVDLPGRTDPRAAAATTVDDAATAILDQLRSAPEPAVLVAHSLGGVPATQAADRAPDRIARLVYQCAFVPRNGQSFVDLASTEEFAASVAGRTQRIEVDEGLSYPPGEHAVEAFYGGCDPDAAAAAARRLVPESLALCTQPVSLRGEVFDDVPRTYVEALQDKAIPIASQRAMHRAAGIADIVALDSDHSPFLSCPQQLAEVLLSAELVG